MVLPQVVLIFCGILFFDCIQSWKEMCDVILKYFGNVTRSLCFMSIMFIHIIYKIIKLKDEKQRGNLKHKEVYRDLFLMFSF